MVSLFDDALFSELKKLSAEELLIKCIGIIDGLDLNPLQSDLNDISQMKRDISLIKLKRETSLIKEKIKSPLQKLQVYLGEIYRRNIMGVFQYINCVDVYLEKLKCFYCNDKNIEYHIGLNPNVGRTGKSELICSKCNDTQHQIEMFDGFVTRYENAKTRLLCDDDLSHKQIEMYSYLYLILNTGKGFKDKLKEIQMVKQTMLRIMKTPLLTKELEQCMDEILDLNGNKISQMKEYLTEEQYRFVRSGAKFEELEGQQEMLDNLNKMLKQLKICAVGQSVLEPPIAYAILVPPAIQHLEKELTTHKTSQKNHEKDLEKLKCKI